MEAGFDCSSLPIKLQVTERTDQIIDKFLTSMTLHINYTASHDEHGVQKVKLSSDCNQGLHDCCEELLKSEGTLRAGEKAFLLIWDRNYLRALLLEADPHKSHHLTLAVRRAEERLVELKGKLLSRSVGNRSRRDEDEDEEAKQSPPGQSTNMPVFHRHIEETQRLNTL